MALKKSDLYSSLWKSADELRGGMDAAQYKDYVLTLLFVKYVSDKVDKTLLDIPAGADWEDIVALRGDKEIGDKINKIIGLLADANGLHGVIDLADFNDEKRLGGGQDMVDRLSKLVGIFQDLDFGQNSAGGDDLLGDAYEYLMRHFASESGKSKGQFYTPAEVSMVLARVVGIGAATKPDQTVYDPACGSGSLLLKAAHEAPSGMSAYGQEMDNATYALARMNMILHGYETAELWQDNTLSKPYFKNPDGALRTFDFAVANPPFSLKAWTNGFDPANDKFKRFELGVPPEKNGDYAFLLHVVKSLKANGKAAVILPHGVLFRANKEAEIRRELVTRRLIKGIIGLPGNLFYGTGIPACIVVIDKEDPGSRKGIFMIDASRGFIKDGNKNRLRAQDIHKIVDTFTNRSAIDGYSRLVEFEEIAAPTNDYNLNIARYIDSGDPEDIQDLDGHLNGGIPEPDVDALGAFWAALPGLREVLIADGDRPGYTRLATSESDMPLTIAADESYLTFCGTTRSRFAAWRSEQSPRLRALTGSDSPKALIDSISEPLLAAFEDGELIDPYSIYQHLMDYWEEEMQDDAYVVVSVGWVTGALPREIQRVKNKEGKLVWPEPHDFAIGKQRFKSDLVPGAVMIAHYFATEQRDIDDLRVELGRVEDEIQARLEEHGVEGGLLEDVLEGDEDKPKVSLKGAKAWLKENAANELFGVEVEAVTAHVGLLQRQASLKRAIKEATDALHAAMAKRYSALTEDEVKGLVVDDKWMTSLAAAVEADLVRVAHDLDRRLRDLNDRYAHPLAETAARVDELELRVADHLSAMGLVALNA